MERLKRFLAPMFLEQHTWIKPAMSPPCRLAVVVPIYDEPLEGLNKLLKSLAVQEQVFKTEFEVVAIVNNSHRQALEKSKEYLQNQLTIKFLKKCEKRFPHLALRIIDKSSSDCAYRENNVSLIRQRAGAEVVMRFLKSDKGLKGIIFFTDADCRFSKNIIREAIDSFNQYNLDGLAGALEFEMESSTIHNYALRKAIELFLGNNQTLKPYAPMISFQDYSKKQKAILSTGQNIMVTVEKFIQVGGVPIVASASDIELGKRIFELKARVMLNRKFIVYTLARPSLRTGLSSFGRQVAEILRSIKQYQQKKSQSIKIQHRQLAEIFYSLVMDASLRGDLDVDFLKAAMKETEFEKVDFETKELEKVCFAINRLKSDPGLPTLELCEQEILKTLFAYFPKQDITDQVAPLIASDFLV
ncbi:MAG: glycosyltransferase family A protein [Patescibacteria group bacterium]